jgi:hypothetical protein
MRRATVLTLGLTTLFATAASAQNDKPPSRRSWSPIRFSMTSMSTSAATNLNEKTVLKMARAKGYSTAPRWANWARP